MTFEDAKEFSKAISNEVRCYWNLIREKEGEKSLIFQFIPNVAKYKELTLLRQTNHKKSKNK